MKVEIRELTEADDEQANDLLNLAFESHTNRLNDLRLYRRLQPDGWFAACVKGRLIGTVGAISYGDFAHIGFMSVHPEMQSQGIGRMLMEHVLDWVKSRKVPQVMLDASRKGFPLYEKLGFKTIDETAIFERQINPVPFHDAVGILPVTDSDLDELVNLDAPIFGIERRKVFLTLMALYPGRAFLQRDVNRKITGYLFAQMNRIGPWVMFTRGHEEDLLKAAMTLKYKNPVSVCVPSINNDTVDLLERNGFVKARAGKHMSLGDFDVPGDRSKVFAQTSLGAG